MTNRELKSKVMTMGDRRGRLGLLPAPSMAPLPPFKVTAFAASKEAQPSEVQVFQGLDID
jgi:hypothetical protein